MIYSINPSSFHLYFHRNIYFSSFHDLQVYFNWQDYITTLTEDLNVNIIMDDIVLVENPAYFRKLGKELITFGMTAFRE